MSAKQLTPLRRRGTLDQRIRRIKKWGRRDAIHMIRRTFPGAWRFFLRSTAQQDARYIIAGILTAEEVRAARFSADWKLNLDYGVPWFGPGTDRPRRP